jgi:hypothetical protein
LWSIEESQDRGAILSTLRNETRSHVWDQGSLCVAANSRVMLDPVLSARPDDEMLECAARNTFLPEAGR